MFLPAGRASSLLNYPTSYFLLTQQSQFKASVIKLKSQSKSHLESKLPKDSLKLRALCKDKKLWIKTKSLRCSLSFYHDRNAIGWIVIVNIRQLDLLLGFRCQNWHVCHALRALFWLHSCFYSLLHVVANCDLATVAVAWKDSLRLLSRPVDRPITQHGEILLLQDLLEFLRRLGLWSQLRCRSAIRQVRVIYAAVVGVSDSSIVLNWLHSNLGNHPLELVVLKLWFLKFNLHFLFVLLHVF